MEFKDFLQFVNEAESTAEKDDKAEKAGKKVAKDIEYDEGHKGKDDEKAEKAGEKVKKDIEYDDKKDKKSLKDWFEIIDKNMLAEAEQLTLEPAKQSTQVIKKGNEVIGSVSNPALAATIKSAIGKGEMSLAGKELKEEPVMEKAPPGMEDVVLSLKKKFPGDEGRAYAIAWSMYNKKHGKNEGAEDNPESAMLEADVEESGLQAYLGKKKYGPEGMKALQQAGRDGASKEKMAQIRAKHDKLDEKWAGDAEVKPTGQYKDKSVDELKSMLAKLKKSGPHDKDSPAAKKMRQINFALRAKGGWKKGEGAAMKEAEIPSSGPDYGAGLGAGRKDNMLEAKPDFLDLDKDGDKKESMKKAAADKKKKKVDESMDKCKAAYHEGKSHGLSKHSYACRYDHNSPEHEHYHKGYKEGLDECYGLMPVQGLVVSETDPVPATVPGMANAALEADMGEGNAFTGKLASTPKGGSFELDGKTFKDTSSLEEFAFESLDKQLNELLSEGISVNMQQDIGAMGDDSVSVTATGDDSAKLLDFIKQVGLGGLGGDKPLDGPAEPAVAVSDYGAPKFTGHDDMKSLLAKVTGDDYKDEEGHSDAPEMKMCGVHKLPEGECGCGEGKEVVDEVETEDQMLYNVAEDDGEGYEQGQEAAAQIDSALAVGSENEKDVNEGGDGSESSPEAAGAVAAADADEEQEEAMSEDEKLDEWANNAGKDGTEQTFERDIEFMTKVISGGLNKPKSTGQTTIPVIAGQKDRMGVDEDVIAEWKKLSGI